MIKVHEYHNDRISVTWDGARCIHAAECLRALPQVFNVGKRPWVQPDRASADEVAEAVMSCPTGALHFTRKDGGPAEPKPAENLIAIERNGPLYVQGDVVMLTPEREVMLEDTRLALCRCGQSKIKPFCDNAHLRAHFRDAGEFKENRLLSDGPPPETRRLSIVAMRNGSFRLQGPMTIYFPDGTELTGNRCALCRCGHSNIKPFCDATHKTIGFNTEESKDVVQHLDKECPAEDS